MRNDVFLSGGVRAACVAGVMLMAAAGAQADLPAYELVGSFAAPGGTFDVGADGRLVWFDNATGSILQQDAVNADGYSAIGSIDSSIIGQFGASFVRVSPDGSKIAIGDNETGAAAEVHVVETASLSLSGPSGVVSAASDNFDAHWHDNDTLFVSGGTADFSAATITRVELGGGTPTSEIVVNASGVAAGGVATNGTHLFVGNGFDLGSGVSETGEVRGFELGVLGGGVVDFSSGTVVADALSGSPLDFDGSGNLIVGGADSFGSPPDDGYASVIDGDAVLAALAGGGSTTDVDELWLMPDVNAAGYFTVFNDATGELLLSSGGTVYRYAVVPGPGGLGVLVMGGVVAARRRRDA